MPSQDSAVAQGRSGIIPRSRRTAEAAGDLKQLIVDDKFQRLGEEALPVAPQRPLPRRVPQRACNRFDLD